MDKLCAHTSTIEPQRERDCESAKSQYKKCCDHYSSVGDPEVDICGPDVTSWLRNRLSANRRMARRLSTKNFVLRHANVLEHVHGDGNFNKPVDGASPFKSANCPKGKCGFTVTICGKCYQDNVPEDINYGVVTSMSGVWAPDLAADAFASVAHLQIGDSADAHASWDAGRSLGSWELDSDDNFCKALEKMKTTARGDCGLCKEKFAG